MFGGNAPAQDDDAGLEAEIADSGPPELPLDERLAQSVLPRVRGKRALIVTNRPDGELQEALRERFEFSVVDHCESTPSRVDSAATRIKSGGYDFVLAGTGFLPHKVDTKLRRVCVDAGTPYVRVNRARPQACLRGLARELGLLQRHGLTS